ncbi:uncharacterized protein BKA55DRAFT_462876, partial [Fusarium redolens]
EPPQITESQTSPLGSLQEPTRAASEAISPPDKARPGTSGFRTASSPASSPTGQSLELDLQGSILAPPFGRASFSLNINRPSSIAPGELINLLASIRVEFNGAPKPHARSLFRREMTGSRLQMILDEKSIYDKELETTGGKFQEVKSEKTTISSHPNIEMVQNSGSKPVALTVRGLSLVKAERSAIS